MQWWALMKLCIEHSAEPKKTNQQHHGYLDTSRKRKRESTRADTDFRDTSETLNYLNTYLGETILGLMGDRIHNTDDVHPMHAT
eukprot:1152442-Pelagomonas_calceolata.AAC.3